MTWTLKDIEARPHVKLSTPLRFKPAADVVSVQLLISSFKAAFFIKNTVNS